MGDFAHTDLTRSDGLYPHLADEPCAGCREALTPDDRCYADWSHIWHSDCWPRVAPVLPDAGSPRQEPGAVAPSRWSIWRWGR